ncbi:MAG: putative ATP-dependent RNA helicase dhr2 [Piccolia ochrophora]|nr:MAG: putative ATP-dependent RNA helicase dhr2 [Piccolia ochrophora]
MSHPSVQFTPALSDLQEKLRRSNKDGDTLMRKKRKRPQDPTSRSDEENTSQGTSQPTRRDAGNSNQARSNSPGGVTPTKTSKVAGRQLKDRARALEAGRKTLPIWSHRLEIRKSLRERDILLLVGETGSGKSTQVPQYLVDEPWCRPKTVTVQSTRGDDAARVVSVGGCIAVTEPRRVAAISLAHRVAAEMGSTLGSASPASQVGYSVRFDNCTSPSTRIKFLTEGMLLQELLRDPWLRQYSAVVVDEIHERGVNVDLVVGFLRKIVTEGTKGNRGAPLRLVVMSATANVETLFGYFAQGYSNQLSTASEAAPVPTSGTPSASKSPQSRSNGSTQVGGEGSETDSWSGFSEPEITMTGSAKPDGVSKSSGSAIQKQTNSTVDNVVSSSKNSIPIGVCSIQGRQYPVKVSYVPTPVADIIDATLHTIFQIHQGEAMPGDILAFLTGQDDIEALEQLVTERAVQLPLGVPKLSVMPLFAALPQQAQQNVFLPTRTPNTRKVILATNIAETSVTVPGVRFVVDCGKAKVKQFRTRLGLDSLLPKPISKASALQRKGRAGREAPGTCFRLYTEKAYSALEQTSTPEILRCDVTQTVLTIQARGVTDVLSFPFLDRPPREALEKALLQLLGYGALSEQGQITELGRNMAKIPLAPALSRVLYAAAEPQMDCLAEVIDVVSALTVENIFRNVSSEEQQEEASEARVELLRREGDHLTLLTTVQKYLVENADRRAWAERRFVSHRAMQAVVDVRKQLRALCHRQGFLKLPTNAQDLTAVATPERAQDILRCFLRGFAGKTARLCPDGSYKTVVGNQAIAIHPSSGLFGRKVEAIMYNEYVFTTKSYAKGVSAIQMNWIGEVLGV